MPDALLSSLVAIMVLLKCKSPHINLLVPHSPVVIHGEQNPEFFTVACKALRSLPLPVDTECISRSPLCGSLPLATLVFLNLPLSLWMWVHVHQLPLRVTTFIPLESSQASPSQWSLSCLSCLYLAYALLFALCFPYHGLHSWRTIFKNFFYRPLYFIFPLAYFLTPATKNVTYPRARIFVSFGHYYFPVT